MSIGKLINTKIFGFLFAITSFGFSGTIEILYNSPDHPIAGFQFDVEGVTLVGASGGAAEDAGFTVQTGGATVLGFAFDGSTFSGQGVMTVLETSEDDVSGACIIESSLVISDPDAGQYPVSLNDCLGIVVGASEPDCSTPVCISFDNVDTSAGTLDVYMVNTEPVSGYQFNLEGVTITGASGGSSEDAGFLVSTSASVVLGFSLQGTTIPAGEGNLVTLSFDGFVDEICFVENSEVFSDPDGGEIATTVSDCYSAGEGIPGCTDSTACNYDAAATVDDGSCWSPEDNGFCDCYGHIEDDCGVCGGDGTTCVGCTDMAAINYDPYATIDDTSCVSPEVTLSYTDYVTGGYCSDATYTDEAACVAEGLCDNSAYTTETDCIANGTCSDSTSTSEADCAVAGVCSDGTSTTQSDCEASGACSDGSSTTSSSCTGTDVLVTLPIAWDGSSDICLNQVVFSDAAAENIDVVTGACWSAGTIGETDCNAGVACLTLADVDTDTDSTMNVMLSSTVDIAGFQFDVSGVTLGSDITSGALLDGTDFSVSGSATTILGFSFSGQVIPATGGLWTGASWDGAVWSSNVWTANVWNTTGYLELTMTNTVDVAGYEIDLASSFEDFLVIGATDVATDGAWMVSTNDFKILGFDVSGSVIEPGTHVLVNVDVTFTGTDGYAYFSDAMFSDSNASSLVADFSSSYAFGAGVFPEGCTHMDACNYDEMAMGEDGSCSFPWDADECDCEGNVLDCADVCGGSGMLDDCLACEGGNMDMDCAGVCFGSSEEDDCGVCDGASVAGCTNPYADNYNAEAACDDGSCEFLGNVDFSLVGFTDAETDTNVSVHMVNVPAIASWSLMIHAIPEGSFATVSAFGGTSADVGQTVAVTDGVVTGTSWNNEPVIPSGDAALVHLDLDFDATSPWIMAKLDILVLQNAGGSSIPEDVITEGGVVMNPNAGCLDMDAVNYNSSATVDCGMYCCVYGPTASFDFDVDDWTVEFTDTSTPGTDPMGEVEIVSWAWDFGDGNTSDEQNPENEYSTMGTYSVTLTVTDALGNSSIFNDEGIVLEALSASNFIPLEFNVAQNFPNPFNPVTNIVYDVAEVEEITLIIYDLNGKEVQTLANGVHAPGRYQVTWDSRDKFGDHVSSGMYIYQYKNNSQIITKKMIFMK